MARKDNKGRNLKTGEYQRPDGRYEYRYKDEITGKHNSVYAANLASLREKEKKIKEAEGQAEAIRAVQRATADGIRYIKEAGADQAVLQLKSLEAFQAAADGKANKIIIPSDIQGIAGLVKSISEIAAKEDTK